MRSLRLTSNQPEVHETQVLGKEPVMVTAVLYAAGDILTLVESNRGPIQVDTGKDAPSPA